MATAPAVAPEPLATVYDKALGPGWENWSWAKTELSADIGSAKMPIMADAKGYEGVYLHHAPFSTAPYRGLSLLIQVVGGNAQVRVIAIAGGKPIPDGAKLGADGQPQPKMKLVALVPGGWKQVVVPLGDLGADNTVIDGIWVQNDSAQPAPHFYIADVAFKP
ncbi:MAG: hypothetical protein WDN44_08715 [Sphingomonas sp.]